MIFTLIPSPLPLTPKEGVRAVAVDYTFVVEKPCPVCMKETRVTKTRSRLVVEKRDEDLCVHYKDFNPYYYKIWVCEHCGFAGDEKAFTTNMPNKHREILWNFLQEKDLDIEFEEKRTFADAVASYELALIFLDMIGAPSSKKAIYNLNLAWVFRSVGEEYADMEREFMLKAAEHYNESLSKERYPIDGLTDTAVVYLIGAIYYRLKDFEKCTQYLSRIIGDQKVRTSEPKVYDKARDLWGDVASKDKVSHKK